MIRTALMRLGSWVVLVLLVVLLLLPWLVMAAVFTGKLSSGADTTISEVVTNDGPGGCAVIDDWSTAGNCDEPIDYAAP